MTRGGRCRVVALLWLATAGLAPPVQAAPRFCHGRHCPLLLLDPYEFGIPQIPAPVEPPQLFIPDQPRFLDPDQAPFFVPPSNPPFSTINPPYSQGFALDVPTLTGDGAAPDRPTASLTRYKQVADALAACWRPPATFEGKRWGEVTLRVSFRKDGSINGLPRIPFASEGLTPDARSDLTQSLSAALRRCTPLVLSPGLGAAVAGQIFALRFIQQDPPS